MYYHTLVNKIANAIRNGDEEAISKIETTARDLLLAHDEMDAIMNLIEAAYMAAEAVNYYE